jgi:hypothetical protein
MEGKAILACCVFIGRLYSKNKAYLERALTLALLKSNLNRLGDTF